MTSSSTHGVTNDYTLYYKSNNYCVFPLMKRFNKIHLYNYGAILFYY